MSQSRRDFIKFVVAGSVTAGCPIDATLLATPAPQVHSEHFEVCHQIRDGHTFDRPAATQKAAIVIIGGGVALFGNADSGGPESLTSESIRLSKSAVEWSAQVLAGNPNAKVLAQKALAASFQ